MFFGMPPFQRCEEEGFFFADLKIHIYFLRVKKKISKFFIFVFNSGKNFCYIFTEIHSKKSKSEKEIYNFSVGKNIV